MKEKNVAEPQIICPFYVRNENSRASVTCEGHTDKNRNVMRFTNLKERSAYMNEYCAADYRFCEIYRLVYACKYEGINDYKNYSKENCG